MPGRFISMNSTCIIYYTSDLLAVQSLHCYMPSLYMKLVVKLLWYTLVSRAWTDILNIMLLTLSAKMWEKEDSPKKILCIDDDLCVLSNF